MSTVLELAQQLIARRSLTPDDAGCCELIGARLQKAGFKLEYINAEGVTNLWATCGSGAPLTIFAGHTDVVPTGPLDQWKSDPFTPTVRDGVLYGRGAADMKSGIAAMVCAAERLAGAKKIKGTLAFLITSDEEGSAQHGTRHVVNVLKDRGLKPDYAIVGEATASEKLGDRITIGRRGSLGCNLKVIGKQGHVAYPDKADNPIHRLSMALAELSTTIWDKGNAHFPPTSFQISNFNAGTGANNVIPGDASAIFNFRYSTESSADSLKALVKAVLDKHCPRHEANWWHTGEPFLTRHGKLIESAQAAIAEVTSLQPVLFTGGGTSDARFLAPWGAEVLEIGPINDSIHKLNEHVNVADLDALSVIYEKTLLKLFA
ncbi:MAG: succinyl-diaminopimelate desuccinylase [Pseudomonadota bacterium]